MRHPNNFLISLISLISLILLPFFLFGQKECPYSLKKGDVWIATGSFITAFGSQYLLGQQAGFTEAELASISPPENINGIDEGTIGKYNKTISRNSYYSLGVGVGGLMAAGTAAIPVVENGKKGWNDFGLIFLLGAESNFITLTGTNIAKGIFQRTRPFVYSETAPLEEKMEPDARHAFFSGHTSLAAANSFLAAKVFSDYYPDSKLKPLVWGAAVALPALVASQRVRAGKHYPTDTAVGYLFGAACGYFVPHLHKGDRKPGRASGRLFPVWGQEGRGIGFQMIF